MNKLYNNHKLLILSVLLMISSAGCVDVVNIKDQLHETEKLVVYCRLCPQIDTISVYVSHTQLLYGRDLNEDVRPIDNAVVQLSADNATWVDAVYDVAKERYLLPASQFPIVEGQTYYIRVKAAGYPDAGASCTVPYGHDVNFHLELVYAEHDIHGGSPYDFPHYDAHLTWQDVPGEENYYAFGYIYNMNSWDDDWNEESKGVRGFPSLQFYLHGMYVDDNWMKMIPDKDHDGELFTGISDGFSSPEDFDSPRWIFFLDKHNYLYHNSLSNNDVIEDFLMEPIQTYSNINGGFGLFSAFSMREIDVPVSQKN